MAENTTISWATDTFNPWWGCRQVSPACRFCYAKAWDKRTGGTSWGAHGERRLFGDKHWAAPLRWNREAAQTGVQRRVFCASMGDVFEDHPALFEPRERLWDLIEATPSLCWLLLTKRPQNAAGMVPATWQVAGWPTHVWAGVSAEAQRFAVERIPVLRSLPVAVRFVSAAPLLGPLEPDTYHGVNWVITEGESGVRARPTHPAWVRSLRDGCQSGGIAFHHKQWGQWAPVTDEPRPGDLWITWEGTTREWQHDDLRFRRGHGDWLCGTETLVRRHRSKQDAGRELDGQVWDQYPQAVTA
jgi:protein gp37